MVNDSGSHGQRVGYIRVSTVEQNNQRQKELLNASGGFLKIGFPAAPRLPALDLSSVWRTCETVTNLSCRRLTVSPDR